MMGGSQSTEPRSVTPPISDQPAVPAGPPAKVGDNNNGDVVVIAVDASKQAETAFRWYVEHVHKPENVVRIIHCRDVRQTSPILAEHAFKVESWKSMIDEAETEGKTILSRYETRLQEHKINGTTHFEVGDPGEILVNSANRHRAAQIIMGTRGFGIVRRTILGSVSEYVIHHTSVPVTVVPKETQGWFF